MAYRFGVAATLGLRNPAMVLRRIVFGLVACFVLLLPAINAQTADAIRDCKSSDQGNWFDGYYMNSSHNLAYEGVSSYIYVQDGSPCAGVANSDSNFSNAWVMIAGHGGTSAYGWGQVGFERSWGYPMRWFSQFSNGLTGSDRILETRYSSFSINNQFGVRHTFRVLWASSCGPCLKATIDTTTWDTSSFNPFASSEANFGPQPWSPQFVGEVGYLEADMPGTPAHHTRWTAMGAQRYTDDALESMPCVLSAENSNPLFWGRTALSCTSFDIWTK
jgi:hypothetical protein